MAAAPCSYGVFELGHADGDAAWLLEATAAAGYEGIDLGPPGALGSGEDLAERLARHGLGLAGGWVQLMPRDGGLSAVHATLDCFDDAGGAQQVVPPRPTLAADGPDQAVAGRPGHLEADAWDALCVQVEEATKVCRDRGYKPVFHPHVGTWIETPEQTESLLEATTVDLCLDTGHTLLGGGDPLGLLRRWRERIAHVHLKDVRLAIVRELAAATAPLREVWARQTFCALGEGDLDLEAILAQLHDFQGWVVVEQDRLTDDPADLAAAADDQRRNRTYLRERGW